MTELSVLDGGNGRQAGVGLPAVTAPPSPGEWEAMKQQASVIARSGLAPRAVSKPEQVLVIALKGRELSIPPMQALSQIHIVEGKPTLSAELMAALVQRAGHKLRVLETSSRKCVVEGVRADDPGHPSRVEWTIEDARAAGVANKGPWKSYPAAMLRARAISALCRFAFADVLMGASYTPEELGAEVDEDGEVLSVPDRGDEAGADGRRGRADREPSRRDPDSTEEAEVVEDAPEARCTSAQAGYVKGLMRTAGANREKIEQRHGPIEEWSAEKANGWIESLKGRIEEQAEAKAREGEAAPADEPADDGSDLEHDPYERLRDLLDLTYADRSDAKMGHEWYEDARLGAPIGTLSTTEVLDLIRGIEDGGHGAE